MQFHYLAADKNGKVHESDIEAESLEEVLALIAKQDWKPISIKPIKEVAVAKKALFGSTISLLDKIFLTKYLSLMLRVGTDLFGAIEVLIKDFDKPILRSFLLEIKGNLERGNRFYVSFQNHPEFFSEIVINLIKAAETSGNLENTLSEISQMYEKEADLKNKIRAALIYPALLMAVSFGVIVLLVTFVLPRISIVFEGSGAKIPFYSLLIINLGNFINKYLIILFPLFITTLVVGYFFFFRTERGKKMFWEILRKTPLVRDLLKKLALQRFAATLASLLKAGIPFVDSLEITATAVGDPEFHVALLRIAREEISRGVAVSDAFRRETVFPNVVVNLVGIGEKSGHLEEILNTLANFYEKEIDNSLKTLVSVFEPVMLIIVGLIVAGIAFSVIVPIYQLVSQYS